MGAPEVNKYPNLSSKECKEYTDKFVEIAGSVDNSVVLAKCASMLFTMGWDKRTFNRGTLRRWLRRADDNDNQTVSLDELLTVINGRTSRELWSSRIRRNFLKMDENGDGEVTKEEAEEYFRRENINHSKGKIDQMFAGIDADGSNTISLDEFLTKFLPK